MGHLDINIIFFLLPLQFRPHLERLNSSQPFDHSDQRLWRGLIGCDRHIRVQLNRGVMLIWGLWSGPIGYQPRRSAVQGTRSTHCNNGYKVLSS